MKGRCGNPDIALFCETIALLMYLCKFGLVSLRKLRCLLPMTEIWHFYTAGKKLTLYYK